MPRRSGLVAALGVALVLAIGLIALLCWQLRLRYENQLIQQIWPPGAEGASVVTAEDGSLEPTTLLLGDSRIGQWEMPRPRSGRIAKAGFPGAATARVMASTRELLAQYRPDLVVIEAGINDLKLAGMRPDLREKIVDTASGNLHRMVNLCIDAHARVLLLLVWPASGPDLFRRPVWDARAVASAVDALNERLRGLNAPAKGVFVLDLLAEAGGTPAYRDTLHLTPGTYERLVPVLEREIERVRDEVIPGR